MAEFVGDLAQPMNKNDGGEVCKQNQRVSFRCAEMAS
jgi:hypothetical protein